MKWQRAADFLRRRERGIRQRFLWVGLLFLGVALLANTLAGSLYTRTQINKATAKLQTEVASRVANEIADIIERKKERLSDLAVSASLYPLGSEEQKLLALLLLKNDRPSTSLTILDNQGIEVVKVSERRVYLPTELSDQSKEEHFKKAVKGESYISQVYTTDKAEPYVTMAVPIQEGPGRIIGVIEVEVNLTFLWQIIGNVSFAEAGNAYLVDSRGNLIAHQDPSLVLKRTNLSEHFKVREFLRRPLDRDPMPAAEGTGITGVRVLSTYAPVRGLGWAVVLTEPMDIAVRDLIRVQQYALLLLGVGLIIGSIVIVLASNKITEPIRELHRGAEIIRQGNLDHRVEIRTGDEIEQLAREFNEMAGELKNSYSMLEQRVERRTRDLSALYDVTTTVNQSLDLDPVLDQVIKKITAIFQFDATRVFLFDAETQELKMQGSFGTHPEFWNTMRSFQRGQGVVGRVAESGEAMIFEDLSQDPRYQELSRNQATRQAGFNFFALFPIKTKLKTVGMVACVCKESRRLTDEEARLIMSMTDQIGVAVEKVNLFDETVARANELSALYDVTATVNQSRDPDAVLRDVVQKVLQLTDFDAARVYLLDAERKELRLRMHHGISSEFAAQTATDTVGVGVNGSVVATGKPAIFQDIQFDPSYGAQAGGGLARRAGFRSYMSFPLRGKTKILGVINFLGRHSRSLRPRDNVLLMSMTNQICVALENANLFEQTMEKAKEISALYDVTTTVNQSLDLESILQEVIKKITDTFDFDTTRIFLSDPQTNEIRVRASYPVGRQDLSRVSVFRPGEGIVGKVMAGGQPILFEDLRNDPRYRELSSTQNTQSSGFCFLSAFPITAKLRSVGIIVCNGEKPRRLTAGEIQLITSMAGQIGVAVENARLFSETKQKSLELEKANKEMLEASRAKADFLAAMSHELRTPLNVIIGNADLCKDGFFGDMTEKQEGAVEKILRYSRILLKLINDVLALTKVEAKKMSIDVSTFDVDEVVAHVQNYVEQLNHQNRVRISWKVPSGLRPLTTDALKLEEILQNLIGNAYKFTPKGAIDIGIRDFNGKDRIEFSVADTGIGIKQENLGKIFEEFHQLEEAHTGTYSGVGLGLSIVKKYLELMGGDIRVQSQPGSGTTFTFTLPYSISGATSSQAVTGRAPEIVTHSGLDS
jgi:signal transduction histidine kinase/putative methionine-R-sulfoxide reductase with GAF domain